MSWAREPVTKKAFAAISKYASIKAGDLRTGDEASQRTGLAEAGMEVGEVCPIAYSSGDEK